MENIEEKIEAFKVVTSREELAEVLDISLKNLVYNLYKRPDEEKYTTFKIRKKSGGWRKICAPISGIKHIQKQLSLILNDIYVQKFCVHGYVKERGIVTNAKVHSRKRIIVNLDLKDFFPSINFGRVRGLFQAPPFLFNDEVATVLAQICCYNNSLPQGAPSSPILSNYICRRLDSQLSLLCRDNKVDYSRYADDLTFSTNLKELPSVIGVTKEDKIVLSKEVKAIIKNNGFKINTKKTRFALKNNRQDVTGLIVNEGVNVPRKYVRHVRAMLHAWETFGLEAAAKEHFEKYNKRKKPDYPEVSFKKELAGKINYIGQIKGTGNRVYISLYSRIKKQDPTVKVAVPQHIAIPVEIPIIFCEGHTDSLHLKAALDSLQSKGEFVDLNIHFYKWPEHININNNDLFDMCRTRPKAKDDSRLEIFLFDRDDKRYTKDACADGKLYKHWEAKVYSALLPIPPHRTFDEICIEHYYSDADIKTEDDSGYRLYLSNEFDPATANHITIKDLYFAANRGVLSSKYPKILDNNVKLLGNDKNVALPKKQFAKHIATGYGRFKGVSFDYFRPVFDLLSEVVEASK